MSRAPEPRDDTLGVKASLARLVRLALPTAAAVIHLHPGPPYVTDLVGLILALGELARAVLEERGRDVR